MSKNINLNYFFLLIILSAIWGSAFFAIKISVETIHPVSVASIRLIIGAIVLFIYFNFKKLKFNFSLNILFLITLIGLVGNFIPFVLISWAEIYIQSNTAGLLLSVAPILTLVLSHFLTKDDKFSLLKLISILIGFLGVIFIIGFDAFVDIYSDSSNNLIAKLAIILSALGYVVSSILAYNLKKIDTFTLTTGVTITAALISLPFLIFVELQNTSSYNLSNIIPLIYLGVFPTAIAFVIRFYIISKAGPIFLSYVAYLIPAFAILWGYVFLKETIQITTFFGVILILLGVFISQKNLMNKVVEKSINN